MAYPKMVKTYSAYHSNLSRRTAGKAGVKYVVVHYTASNASAKNNCIYFAREGSKTGASADYFIEKDGTIYKYNGNCKKHYSWAVGDGHGAHGITNANSISIEVVSDGKAAFTAKQVASLGKLVKAIQADFGIPCTHVVRHWEASRKECPLYYSGETQAKQKRWNALRKKIATA